MFLKNNLKKVRSIFSSVAVAGVAATALFWSANTSVINAQTETPETNAPSGGAANKFLDFTGNGTTDWTTVSFATGGPITWRVTGNPANPAPNQAFIRVFDYGSSADDSIVVGDYVGDNKTDLAVFRAPDGSATGTAARWYLAQFPITNSAPTLDRVVSWGDASSDIATTGDYDGDGKADYAAVRAQLDPEVGGSAASLYWYVLSSSTNTARRIKFGQIRNAAGAPATGPAVFNGADFNGDGRDELIYITRNAAGTVNYFAGDALTGAGVVTRSFGNYNTDYSLTPADYTGDGRADFIACRQNATDNVAVWYILNSATGAVTATRFGIADPLFAEGDIPVRGDYDGDNRHDIAVWRPFNQTFYYISSQFNNIQSQQWGLANDTPLGAFGQY